jgi:hypothetical protein
MSMQRSQKKLAPPQAMAGFTREPHISQKKEIS